MYSGAAISAAAPAVTNGQPNTQQKQEPQHAGIADADDNSQLGFAYVGPVSPSTHSGVPSVDNVQAQLAKESLGLKGDVKEALKSAKEESAAKQEEDSGLSRYESLLDDEFDECFDDKENSGSNHGPDAGIGNHHSTETQGKSGERGEVDEGERCETNGDACTAGRVEGGTDAVAPPKPDEPKVISKDINEINRIWREKQNKMRLRTEESTAPSTRPKLEPSSRQETSSKQQRPSQNDSANTSSSYMHNSNLNLPGNPALNKILAQSADEDPTQKQMGEVPLGLQNVSSVTNTSTADNCASSKSPMSDERRQRELAELRAMAQPQPQSSSESDSAAHDADPDSDMAGWKELSVRDPDRGTVVKAKYDYGEVMCLSASSPECTLESIMGLFSVKRGMATASTSTQIQPVVAVSGWRGLKRMLVGPPRLHKNLLADRDAIFYLAKTAFENSNKLHGDMLRAVYRGLTGSGRECARFGEHWREIGFQGTDPTTDLRAMGMLGLFHLCYLVLAQPTLAKQLHHLSLDEVSNFDLAVLSINISKSSLAVLREERLNKMANGERCIISPFNDLYLAMMTHFHTQWQGLDKTIADIGVVLAHIDSSARKDPRSFVLNFRKQGMHGCSTSDQHSSAGNETGAVPVSQKYTISAVTSARSTGTQPATETHIEGEEDEILQGFVGVDQLGTQ